MDLAGSVCLRPSPAERDIFAHRQPRQKAVLLKNKSAIRTRPGDWTSIQFLRPCIRILQPSDDPQERAFAATAAANNAHKLPAPDGQVDALEHWHALAVHGELLVQAADEDLQRSDSMGAKKMCAMLPA